MRESKQWSELADLDAFFYYADLDLDHANQHDVAVGVVQPKRSLFYDREDSAGVSEYENLPNGFYLEVMAKYDIANWIARRNTYVSAGQDGTKDRRLVTSQTAIEIARSEGNLDVNVLFIDFGQFQQPTQLRVPVGGAG